MPSARRGPRAGNKHAAQKMMKLLQILLGGRGSRGPAAATCLIWILLVKTTLKQSGDAAFDPTLIHEEEVVHQAPDDDEKESAEKSEPAQVKEDKE